MFAQHFQFDQIVAIQQFPGQLAGADRIFGGVAAGSIGQDGVAFRGNHVQQIGFIRVLAQIGTAYGHSHDLGATGLDGMAGFHQIMIFASAHQQAGLVNPAGDFQGFVFGELNLWCLCHNLPELSG